VGSFVDDLALLLRALGVSRVGVLGSSAGSMVGGGLLKPVCRSLV
jgi:pimeloyl-ACP methyl ester carboxylesterase